MSTPKPSSTWQTVITVFSSRTLAVTFALGFASGLPLALTAGTLQAWMTVRGVSLQTIGLFALVGLPYTLKFLWAPLLDRFAWPGLGRRRGWLLFSQLALVGALGFMSQLDPVSQAALVAICALLVSFLSATQDIAFDAWRTDTIPTAHRGLGAAVSVFGYRMAMLVSGGLALILSAHWGWALTYQFMALLLLLGVLATLWAPEQLATQAPKTLLAAVWQPLQAYFTRPFALSFLLLIVLYKLGDAFAGTLTTAFLLRGVGFSVVEIGALNKVLGMTATIIGALLGGVWMLRLGLYRALWWFGLLQAGSNLLFALLAWVGKSYPLLVVTIGVENLAGGMGTAAAVALLTALCDRRFSATQYALLSALAAIGRVYVGPSAGWLAPQLGWTAFFLATTVLALPGLILLRMLRLAVQRLETT